jgi:7-carboxy-7-deazaguanine synthase
MSDTLLINEIYLSLQGESSFAGWPCIFIRLTACHLRCSYCDTAYAFTEGNRLPAVEILERVQVLARPYAGVAMQPRLPLVELTGGEPLLQPGVFPLMTALSDAGFTVLLETNGALDISAVDPRVHRIMDLKCPSSGELEHNRWANLRLLRHSDEVKFVVGTAEDYAWMQAVIKEHDLAQICPLLVSWVGPLLPHQRDPSLKPIPPGHTPLSRRELAERVVADVLPVRFQVQLHKVVWPVDQRGV